MISSYAYTYAVYICNINIHTQTYTHTPMFNEILEIYEQTESSYSMMGQGHPGGITIHAPARSQCR